VFIPAVLCKHACMLIDNRIDLNQVVLFIGTSVLRPTLNLAISGASHNRSSINWSPSGSQSRLDTAGGFLLSRRNLRQGLVKVCIAWMWRRDQGESIPREGGLFGFHSGGRSMFAEPSQWPSALLTGGSMNQVCWSLLCSLVVFCYTVCTMLYNG
jgi:hypothetical protein